MNAYHLSLLLGVGRLLLAFALLFVLYPRVVFAWAEDGRVRRPTAWEAMLMMAGLTVAGIYVLVLLGLYDPIGLLLLYLLVAGATFLRRNGRAGGLGKATETYRAFLARLDAPPEDRWRDLAARAPGRRRRRRAPAVALAALLLYAAATRLAPVVGEAAAFSVHAYAVLEGIKYLQLGELVPTGTYVSRGVQSVILTLFAVSRVEIALLVHLFGAAAAVLVTYGLYRSVRDLTGSAPAGLFAGAVFAVGAPLLPFNVQHQVEANAALLASAFAVPAVVLLGRHLARGDGRHLRAGVGALAAAVLTHGGVGAAAVAALVVLAAPALVRPARRRRGGRVLGLAAVGAAMLLVPLVLVRRFAEPLPAVRLAEESVFGTPFSLYAPVAWLDAAVPLLAAALLLVALRGRAPLRGAAGRTAAVLAGLYGAYRLAWTDAVPALNPEVMGLLLSLAVCVAAGLALHALWVFAEAHVRAARRAPGRHRALTAGLAVLAVGLTAGLAVPRFGMTVEPSGFVRGLTAVQRASAPYAWTVVSHYGTGIRSMNGGWFMDYGYFLNNYDPSRYEPGRPGAVPTPDTYVFIEKDPLVADVVDELMPVGDRLMLRTYAWCRSYAGRRPLPVFYEDDEVIVYRITVPPDRRGQRGPRAN